MTDFAAGLQAKGLVTTLPLFPLAGVVLLPETRLPLNIFEPRYLAMTRDALAGPKLIGMIQPIGADSAGPKPELYRAGCAGRIIESRDTEDGRILIALHGQCRFEILEELAVESPYRQARVSYRRFAADLAPPAGAIPRQALLAALKDFVAAKSIRADWQAISRTPDEQLVNSLSMICPFAPNEKQGLLEAADLAERARLLLSLLEIGKREGQEAPARH
jgi:Lon protease-like protein